MERNLEIFNYENKTIRTVIKDEEPWFVAKDICDVLGIKDTRTVIDRLENDEWDKTAVIDNVGRNQDMYILTESGVYEAIIRSNKKEANDFKRWLRKQVIPTIRKTGGYVANDDMFINTYLPFADANTKLLFSNTLKTIREQNQTITELRPKADYFDALVERNLLTNLRDTAKELHVAPGKFNNFLIENGFIYRDSKKKLKPYQTSQEKGLFELKEYVNDHNGHIGNQLMVTPKGRETFRLLIEEMC